MISEISFSRGYSSFWIEQTPWLNDYVSFLNKGIAERVFLPIEIMDDPSHRSINNVIAFTLFKNTVLQNKIDLKQSLKEAIKIIKNYPRNNLDTYKLTKDYKRIIQIQSNRLVQLYKSEKPTFYPQFAGCGILENCQGDLLYGNTLVEIKAGERGITPTDIRQLIIYSALSWLSKDKKEIENIELFNPRQGIYWKENIADCVLSISNVSMEDLFDQISKYLSELSDQVELI
jgi:hypothetical protein